MSDSSELSDSTPNDATIEEELRKAVHEIWATKQEENLTVKRVRIATEASLGLEDGFLKQEAWKDRSKEFIEREAAALANEDDKLAAFSPDKKSKLPPKPSAKRRPSPEGSTPPKRRKLQQKPAAPTAKETTKKKRARNKVESSERELSDLDDSACTSKASAVSEGEKDEALGIGGGSKARCGSDSEMLDVSVEDPKPKPKRKSRPTKTIVDEDSDEEKGEHIGAIAKQPIAGPDSESEMSELVDEDPKPKRKKKAGSAESVAKEKGPRGPKRNSKEMKKPRGGKEDKSPELDPDAAEIKRLQGWLVKCGIRKMWWRELQSYETPKAKIRHLRDMLSEAGMTGRFSVEKASEIRETRELQADLEAVQAAEKHWGKSEEDGDGGGRSRRKIAKGLEGLDFLNDDDGEETD